MKLFSKINILKTIPAVLAFIIALAGFFLLNCEPASASGSLAVEFKNGSGNPLFSSQNMMPGDVVSSWIRVTNGSTAVKNVGARAQNFINEANFGNALMLTVKQGSVVVYEKKLTDFFADDFAFFSAVDPGETVQYDLTLYFDAGAGNEFQGKSLAFDLHIGSDGSITDGGGGQSSAVLIGTESQFILLIENIRAENIKEDGAVIKWETNIPGTTQVIISGEDVDRIFDPVNPPKYGYNVVVPEPENEILAYDHQVILTDLKPCFIYFYRVLSHQKNVYPTISAEHQFTTVCIAKSAAEEKKLVEKFRKPAIGPITSTSIQPQVAAESAETQEEEETCAESEKIKTFNFTEIKPETFLGDIIEALGSNIKKYNVGFCLPGFPWWLFLVFIFYPAWMGWSRRNQAKKEINAVLNNYWKKTSNLWIASSLLPITVAFWAYFSRNFCLSSQWLLFLLLATVAAWWYDGNKTREKLETVANAIDLPFSANVILPNTDKPMENSANSGDIDPKQPPVTRFSNFTY